MLYPQHNSYRQLIDLSGLPLSIEICRPFQITAYQQPSLIYPNDGAVIDANAFPTFSFTPVVPAPLFPVTYRLRIYEDADFGRCLMKLWFPMTLWQILLSNIKSLKFIIN